MFQSKPTHMQKKSPSWLNSVLTYCKFNIENYVWKAQVYLTTPIWTNWIKQMHLCMPNHIQKINFMPMFILINFIPRFILTCCFERLWARPTATTWNNWINLLLPLIPYHMTNYLSSLKAYPGIPDHTHLKQLTNIC